MTDQRTPVLPIILPNVQTDQVTRSSTYYIVCGRAEGKTPRFHSPPHLIFLLLKMVKHSDWNLLKAWWFSWLRLMYFRVMITIRFHRSEPSLSLSQHFPPDLYWPLVLSDLSTCWWWGGSIVIIFSPSASTFTSLSSRPENISQNRGERAGQGWASVELIKSSYFTSARW